MRALLLAENWPPRVGGIENYLFNIAQHLPSGTVTVVAPLAASEQLSTNTYKVERRRFFWPFIKPAWLPLFIYLFRKVKREEIDLVLCGKALFEGLAGYYLKRYLGTPYIVFTYAMEIETWAKRPRLARKLQRVLTNADRVVYINDVTRQFLRELGVKDSKLVKIWPGVDERFFNNVSEHLIAATLRGYGVKQPYIVTVGRLIERKGIDTLIEAFSQLDQTQYADYQLVIVGDGPQAARLEKVAEDNFMATSVKILRQVPDKHLPAIYTGAELFALTPREAENDREGFGIVYLEAAACGKPAVATATGGVPEAVVDKKTGLIVQPDSPEQISEALSYFLAHDKERKKMGERARRRAASEFRWSKRIELVQEMMDSVLS